ncbi:AtpZ/AtpI family protein [Patescibacteria group bacterium]|nr:AtpZ/AtpI family protein [Patescibacteria group bacterium]MBU3999657.1 AtpZ/AtpI family protein [Patescibacteria group bacterium]MBU4057172.1 AtpZ/AtpI family protein [Patescibacteria group bacterium]MBU4369002.1 AtpZ/AtpI family protein [Patescibacteria group bacterium]
MSKPKDDFKLAYAISLVGQLGFYIVVPLIISILAGRYFDKKIFSGEYILTLIFPLLAGIFSIWQIYKLILPLMEDNGKGKE